MMGISTASSWLRLQSGVVLPAARTILLIKACLCFLVVIGALCAAAFFEWLVIRPAPEVTVPAPYTLPQAAAIDMALVDLRFAPPKNIRFEANTAAIDQPLTDRDVLGQFAADTPNGMAKAPDDFTVVGGKDAALFSRFSYGLIATPVLRDKINDALPKLTKPERLVATIQVVARDAYGNASQPTDVTVNVTYGSAPAALAAAKPAQAAAPQVTDLQRIARAIALIADPDKSPRYFDEYVRATSLPDHCAAGQTDAFVRNYASAFDREQKKITAQNVEAFYYGVCAAWERVVATETAARASVEAARVQAFARNEAARRETAFEAIGAWAARNVALIVTAAAVGAFLLAALLLAFLAMENHSKALREAVQALVSLEVARSNQST